ncbi:zinc finger protein 112-like [Sabethes cyaneus]|uniref:zinc finger protein 112-like n=1 Tax=Sabethes cyaneus TaxID=53552 RepID=UPI00237DFE27|nr:zinc finger protein 112-like [Sabethes cyaneus]
MRSRWKGRRKTIKQPCSVAGRSKRPCRQEPLQCRLCLRFLSQEELSEIFPNNDTSIQEAISAAVSIEVTQQDRTVRICHSCLNLVLTVNDFRIVCEKSQQLFAQGEQPESGAEFWTDPTDREVFVKCFTLVQHCKDSIEKQYVNCGSFSNNLPNQRFDLLTEHGQESRNESQQPDLQVKCEVDVWQVELNVGGILENNPCGLKSEQENQSVEHSYCDDSIDGDLNTPERELNSRNTISENENRIVDKKTNKDRKPDFVTKSQRPKRACQLALLKALEEQSKRKGRKPKEPKKKRGRPRLSAQICEICGKSVKRLAEEQHRNEHLGVRPYRCTIEGCTATYYSKISLRSHLYRHTHTEAVYDCDICGAKIKGRSSVRRHRRMHTSERPHACDICGKRFWRRAYLAHHATVHTGIAKFPCQYCGFVFKNKNWWAFHIKQKHVNKGKELRLEGPEPPQEHGDVPEDGNEISIGHIKLERK